jgi:hypothetical protein
MKSNLHLLYKSLIMMILCFFALQISAQVVSPYKQYPLLRNSTHIHHSVSTNNGIQVKRQLSNGSIAIAFVSNNNYRITYTPDPGFVGTDTLVYEFWNFINPSMMAPHFEHVVYHVRAIIPSDDFITIRMNDSDVLVDVIANDQSDLPINLQSIVFGDNIIAEIENGQIKLNPISPGNGFVRYQVCDEDGNCELALLNIRIEQTTIADTLIFNDFTLRGRSISAYFGDGDYTVVLNPAHGNLQNIGNRFVYSPNNTYTGSDQFKLERIYEDTTQLIIANIQIIPFAQPGRMVQDDRVFTSRNDIILFNVLDNDLIKDRPLQSHTQPANGQLTYLGAGEFRYTPNYNYTGVDQFTYRVCAINNINCEVAKVQIRIDNFLPEKGIYTFVGRKDQSYVFRYPAPIQTFEFEVVEQAFHGDISFHEGLQNVQIGQESIEGYNLLIYTPPFGFTGMDEMRVQYCAGGDCRSVKIYMQIMDSDDPACYSECVWPSDANRDGEVNIFDLLPLTFHNGFSGTSRSVSDSLLFLPYYSEAWGKYSAQGIDFKHFDANGDGSINLDDQELLVPFYNKQSQIKPVTNNPLLQVPFIIELATPEVEIGETAIFNIHVGTSQYPAIDFSGLAFQLNLGNANFFDTSTLQLTLFKDSWLAAHAPVADLSVKASGHLLDGGISRLDAKHKSGFGIVAKVEGTIVRDIGGFHLGGEFLSIPISMSSNEVMDGQGNVYTLPSNEVTLRVRMGKNSKYASSGILVFPNPAVDWVTVKTLNDQQMIHSIEVFNISGIQKMQQQLPASGLNISQLDISSLSAGMYILQVRTNEGVYTSKLKVSR